MSKSDQFEYNMLRMVFNGVAISNICTTAGTTAMWLGFCTADPGDAGSTANEGGYAQYARVATDRSTAANGWAVTSGSSVAAASASPVGNIDAPQNTSTSTGTFTHAVVYPSSSATGDAALYIATVSPSINFSQNVTPRLTTASSITEQ